MKNLSKNILLYLSAFVPMYFLLLLKMTIELFNQTLHINAINIIYLLTLIFLIVLGVCGVRFGLFLSKGEEIEVKILHCQNITDRHFLGYFSLFVLFALQINLSLLSSYFVFIAVLFMIGIVYINNSLFYINPFLNLLGYNFFEICYCETSSQEQKTCKIFFKGQSLKEQACVKLCKKNQHFSFVDKNLK